MSEDEIHETSSENSSQLMSIDSTSLLIEALEIQLQELTLKNEELFQRVKGLEDRIKTLQSISDSEIINMVFSFLYISVKLFVFGGKIIWF
jgi:hypothetical protein